MSAKTQLYQAVGRASVMLDPLRAMFTGRAHPGADGPGRDRTGLLVTTARRLDVLHADDRILFVRYDSLAHSFWRAQELSLLRMHKHSLEDPVLDFGAGDGSFSSALFTRLEWGVDTDPDALAIARHYSLYRSLVQCSNDRIPLADGVAGSVVSNSVLEHVNDVDATLSELARVLRPSGRLAFTVPLVGFTQHLVKWFGAQAALAVNAEASHRHLLEADEWVRRLMRLGFELEVVRQYQPDWFTFWYRMQRLLGPRGLGRIPGVQAACWRLCGSRMVGMVRESITSTTSGANLFVVARKARQP